MRLLRLSVLATIALYAGSTDTSAASLAASRKPNVLLILTDDQGYGDLSLHGNPYLKTPHIDKLGQAGVRFGRFYVNSFCSPTRAALLTGRYPLRCGVWGVTHNKEAMRPEEVTLAEALRTAGYRTGCFGKWHNGEQFPYTPPGQGFDEFLGFHNGHINNYFDSELIRGAQPTPTRGYVTDVLTDEAMRFVRANRDRPFFCYLAYNAPHSPYQVPVGHAEENPVTLNAPQAYFEGSLRFFAGPGFAHDWLTGWRDKLPGDRMQKASGLPAIRGTPCALLGSLPAASTRRIGSWARLATEGSNDVLGGRREAGYQPLLRGRPNRRRGRPALRGLQGRHTSGLVLVGRYRRRYSPFHR